MISVTDAKFLDNYKIYVVFNDLKKATLDLKSVIFNDHREIFKALQNIDEFKKFKVAADTIVWENGLDLAPEYLYSLAQE